MKHVHLIGIGGTGISSIARVLLEMGYTVSGSDRVLSPLARDLQAAGAIVFEGHRAEQIAGADLVVRSSAISDENPEVLAARQSGLPVLKRSEFLGQLMQGRDCLAVAGTHGKTTTTAMLAYLLTALGKDPSYIIGGIQKNLHSNAHAGTGQNFVIEADEYDRMFLGLQPWIAIVTNMEHDHPDCYPTLQEYTQAFVDFAAQVRPGGTLLACADDPAASSLAHQTPTTIHTFTYGTSAAADYQASGLQAGRHGFRFTAFLRGQMLARVELQVPGEHNVRNALAALAAAQRLGLPLDQAARALGEFQGSGRRFEILGEPGGIAIIDDYAHHPTEIRATLAAARSRFPGRRIWAVWQPHTYSRTQTLLSEFAAAFAEADQVIVTEVYAAREARQPFSAARVVECMSHPAVRFIPGLADATAYLLEHLRRGDVVLVLSAGDADQINAQLLNVLSQRSEK